MKKFIVTTSWDDGNKFDLQIARLLDKYQLKGTFYVSPKLSNGLSNIELKKIELNHEIGAHTITHPVLTDIPIDRAEAEIKDSKKYLENLLKRDISMFCYPKGYYNQQIKEIVKNSGFLGARTCVHGNFEKPKDPYQWQITLHASNGSPLMTTRIWIRSKISVLSLFDWEYRAKNLFDLFLEKGGIYHIWGHSWEIENNNEWDKLERVFKYISQKKDINYLTNKEIFEKDF
ncbi:MAG: polysaccharide deacetylase family protein [Candidatus Bathyarchaeia archaeon]|jgi:peptidoglycan/xylan/chitin deacetylase (PgdA/CDA1 family)